MVKVRSSGTVPFSRYFRFCNVLRLWNVRVIPTYRVHRLYDISDHDQKDNMDSDATEKMESPGQYAAKATF